MTFLGEEYFFVFTFMLPSIGTDFLVITSQTH